MKLSNQQRVLIGLFALISNFFGCRSPDALRTGLFLREAYGRYNISNERKVIPSARIEAAYDIAERIKGNAHFGYVIGDFDFLDNGLNHQVQGDMESFGIGARYYPFCEHFGLESGTELFRVQADAMASFRFFKREVNDNVYGYGANIGAFVEFPVNKNTKIFFTGGYSFTDDNSNRINFDFDGYYTFFGLEIRLH